MASPLHVFRKHQKTLMIVFGILLMISFLVVGVLDNSANNNYQGQQKVEVVAVWDRGDITDLDIDTWRRDRQYAANLVANLMQQATAKKRTIKGDPIRRDLGEQDLIVTMLLARKAKEEHIEVSKDAVRQYLAGVAGEGMTDDELRRELRAIGDGRFTLERLFIALERELLANNMIGMMNVAEINPAGAREYGVPPAAAWEYFNRLHRRAKVELLPIEVADFLAKAPEPTDAQVQELYEKHKNDFSFPGRPEPGFKVRRKIAFEWLKSDTAALQVKLADEYLKEELPKVTDQEIREYYDRNKFDFKKEPVKTESGGEETGGTEAGGTGAGGTGASETPPAETSPAETPATETPPAEAPPAEAPPAEAPAPDSSAAFDERYFVIAQEETPEAESPASEPESAPEAITGDESAPPSPEPPSPESPATEPAVTEPPAAEPPAAEPPAAEPPAPEAPEGQSPAIGETPASPAAPAPAAVEYKPLDEVKEEIRERIARGKANQRASTEAKERMTKSIDDAQRELKKFSRDYRMYLQSKEIEDDTSEATKEPQRPDFEALAKKYGLTSGRTEKPLDALAIAETEIGQANRMIFYEGQIYTIPFADSAYREAKVLFSPQLFGEGFAMPETRAETEFLYWKTEDQDAYVPELKEVREEVVRAWRMEAALKLAQDEADALAAKARDSKESLLKKFPNQKPFETTEFSWMTRGATPFGASGAPTFSKVFHADGGAEVKYAGDDFMKNVFRLQPGEVGVAVDEPHETVYVVKMVSDAPPVETRRELFLNAGLTSDIVNIAITENATRYRNWIDRLEEEWELRWVRTPGESNPDRQM